MNEADPVFVDVPVLSGAEARKEEPAATRPTVTPQPTPCVPASRAMRHRARKMLRRRRDKLAKASRKRNRR